MKQVPLNFLIVFFCLFRQAIPAAPLPTVLPGFKIELLHQAPPGGDSWVCMTSDAKGRLVISPEGPGGYLTQVTLSSNGQVVGMKKIDRPVGSAMGLAFAFGNLYIDGDGIKGFGVYRLPYDAKTDQYGSPILITRLLGYAPHEHGAHGIVAGKDDHLYIVGGDLVQPPANLSSSSPLSRYGIDQILPPDNDPDGLGAGAVLPEGFVVRVGTNGENPELFCGGLRNVYAIAFNSDGELFGFDNDAEADLGLPWYRPNALYHLVSGADYGYRQGSAKWPHDYPDSWPDVVETGLGCPTGLKFGDRSNFPGKYKTALYGLDWCSGRILAVYLTPKGASYQATFSTFVEGKPLNVTDLEFGGDGAMYFITGGRKTQSSLYRVSYTGPQNAVQTNAGSQSRDLRHALERFHGLQNRNAVRFAWQYLDSDDPFIRSAARLAIESQPAAEWQAKALTESRTNTCLTALLALARCGAPRMQPLLLQRLEDWKWQSLNTEQQLEKLRVIELSFIRQGIPSGALADAVRKDLDSDYPSPSERINAELCPLLVTLQAPDVVEKTLALLDAAATQEEQIRYIYDLRMLQSGWTIEQRKHYFAWFNHRAPGNPPPSAALLKWFADAGLSYSDGSSLPGYLANFRKEALDSLTPAEREELAPWLAANTPAQPKAPGPQHHEFVKDWTMENLLPLLERTPGNAANGKKIFVSAGCSQCHRFGGNGGVVGPDLTAISGSNSPRDILDSILEPSRVIPDQYRNTTIVTKSGDQFMGRVVSETQTELEVMTDLLNRTTVKVVKANIEKRELSNISPMPPGLLSWSTAQEIADLLAYLESGISHASKP